MTWTMFALGCAAGALAYTLLPFDLQVSFNYRQLQSALQLSSPPDASRAAPVASAAPMPDASLITGSVAAPAVAGNLALRPSMPADAAEADTALAVPADPVPPPPETVSTTAGDPEALCESLTAAGFHGAQWQRGGNGEWSCTPDVERFGRDGASLFATILGEDAETVSLVRLKLNLVSEAANEGIKQRAVHLIQRFEQNLGWSLPAEAEAALLAATAYQFADSRWQFVVRPQENDPARVNVFLRRAAAQKIDMRGGL